MTGEAQGRCETTMTERFAYPGCSCGTYPDNLGPCKTFERNAAGRCVYCHHMAACHEAVTCSPCAEVMAHDNLPSVWVVRRRNGRDIPDYTLFAGPAAHARALEYAAWKYGGGAAVQP